MTDNELLLSISEILDQKIKPLEYHLDALDTKVDNVEQRLKNEIRLINLKLENNIEPRLQNIENCYLSTYERYRLGSEKINKHEMDIQIIQSVMKEHGELLHSQAI